LLATAATTQPVLDVADIERQVAPYLEHEIVSGLVVGILQRGKASSFGFGTMSPDDPRVPGGATIFEIGSITKVFTGILLAHAVMRDELSLDDSLHVLLPPSAMLEPTGAPILLRHLATHTSGLPRDPDNLNPSDPANPFADYTQDRLYGFLRVHEPIRAPDTAVEYSNVGAGLLGHVLELRAGLSYEELLRRKITEPLGMADTGIELDSAMRDRLAPPLMVDGSRAANWDLGVLAGAGAIRSTANDMLRFLSAQLQPPQGELGQAIDLAWQVHRQPKQPSEFAMGLLWHLARDGQTRWHNGGTGGYHAMLLASRDVDAGVVVLCNTATFEVDRLAEDLMRLAAGVEVQPRSFDQADRILVSAEILRRYTGRYAVVPEFVLTVTSAGERLFVQATGQPKFEVFAKSQTEFFWKVVPAELSFHVDAAGNALSLTLHQNGRNMLAQRVQD
jgi:CubicO group peptidase (beta-lactamase class C family)